MLLYLADTTLLYLLRHYELHRPLQLRGGPAMAAGWSSEVLHLHLHLPLAAPQQVQVQLLPFLPHLGLPGWHGALHNRHLARPGLVSEASAAGRRLLGPWPWPVLHASSPMAVAFPGLPPAPAALVDAAASAHHLRLGPLLPLLPEHGQRAAIPLPGHAVRDVVLAGDRALLLHAVPQEADLGHDRAGGEGRGRRRGEVPGTRAPQQGGVHQPRRKGSAAPAGRPQDPGGARQHLDGRCGVAGTAGAHPAQGRDRLRRLYLENRPRLVHSAGQAGPHCADDHGLRGAVSEDQGRGGRVWQKPGACPDL
mmetsp:Transcript_130225/g.308980  ORF Transcript_130225/g.308980 Transcript_130225/m.308980 type:complete len:308 (+) Transcript_130225:672-1595(+)